ncbi:hypothetical protein BJ508DRAFT_48050 [Ascobolus immersus RN42]|uniref:BTB domain-containing protein n=1 Tax=Ascobolus immersus RN42 TaxID=1160509 RepID=A0A3N4HK52_ASCIM|nr:hypothetical protein BJ508DRAFT_48050 [Ascobolus immersus RN42]
MSATLETNFSRLTTSATITVCLVRPAKNSTAVPTSQEACPNGTPSARETESTGSPTPNTLNGTAEEDTTPMDESKTDASVTDEDPSDTENGSSETAYRILSTYHLHISALTAHSSYFKGLIAFNGLELSTNKILFESPIEYDDMSLIAMGCFIDFIYTGTYNTTNYDDVYTSQSIVNIRMISGRFSMYLSIYVLAERILCDILKLAALRDMYALLAPLNRMYGNDYSHVPLTQTQKSIYGDGKVRRFGRMSWVLLIRGIATLFDGTVSKPATVSDTSLFSKDEVDSSEAKLRVKWTGVEPMRNMVAAFFAGIWTSFEVSPTNRMAGIQGRKDLIEGRPELMELILAYMSVGTSFNDIPLSEFGLKESEKRDLELPTYFS